ncbi:Arc family DNA-binding protein [Mesorhizobium sp. B1-1-7]|uniref:Arc family DNA-binding protein n=1 Tax=Mesorhizobium sp. B1-1-7 TaxID=2589977 RepID=UPI00112B8E81|nr:Arc family DNA-binding protein [Mesorhizobium sp. B1-1-7]TPN43233.1 Arc family DNA-binding protein [Mesorhizobium sp. B1-1-7]
MAAEDRLTIHVRITPSLLKRIKLAAVSNERSLNAEVTARLERSFPLEADDRDAVLKLLADAAAIIDKGKAR